MITPTGNHKGLLLATLIWLLTLSAALLAVVLRGMSIIDLWLLAVAGALPALLTLVLIPILHREWAQILVIFGWLALAIFACIAIGFNPMAVLFFAGPAIAALFQKDKVVEALILSAVFAALVFYAERSGVLPDTLASAEVKDWAGKASLMSIAAIVTGALFGAAQSRIPNTDSQVDTHIESHLLETIPGAALQLGPEDTVTYISPKSYPLFGLTDDMGTIPASALLSYDSGARDSLLSQLSEVRASQIPQTRLIPVCQEIGKRSQYEVTITPLTHNNIGIYAADVTEREHSFESLRSSLDAVHQDASGKTLFFAGVSHELRTPLNAIIGFSDMMRSRLFGPLPSKYAEYADLIHDSGQYMLDLIGDVLDLTKVETGNYTLNYGSFDVADVIRSTIKMTRPMADSAEVSLDADIEAEKDLILHADRKAVRQILLNLISNAIKFTPKGGRIVVQAKTVADTLALTVRDNGAGMSAEDLANVGKPFAQGMSGQTSDERGSGLGLSLVKSLTALHNGRFLIASQPEAGTTVDVYLPLSSKD